MTAQTRQAPSARDTILEAVRREPGIPVAELAARVRRLNLSREALERVRDAIGTVIAAPASPENGSDDWGAAPTAAQLAEARAAQEHARHAALAQVLEGALTREQAASRLGITPQAVSERLRSDRLTAVRRGREWRFPAWQFGLDDTLPGLSALVAAWPGTPVTLSTWAVTPSPDLDGATPAETLARRHGPERVAGLIEQISAAAW